MSEEIEEDPGDAMDDAHDHSYPRASTGLQPLGPSTDMDDLVQNMNELAGKDDEIASAPEEQAQSAAASNNRISTRQSPRKRPAADQGQAASSPPKRPRTQVQFTPVASSEVTRPARSSGLKMRTKNPVEQKVGRDKHSLEFAGYEQKPVQRGATIAQPPPKMRALNKKTTTANPSPFKGRDTLRTSLAGGVNLNDSPSRRTRSKVQNTLPVTQIANPMKSVRLSPKGIQDIASTAQKRKKPAARAGPPQPVVDEGIETSEEADQATLVATKTRRKARQTTTSDNDVDDSDNDEDEDGKDSAEEDESVSDARPLARKNRKEQQGDEEEIREANRSKALHRIKQIAELHGCTRLWGDLLVGAFELDKIKRAAQVESEEGKRLLAKIGKVRRRYKVTPREQIYEHQKDVLTDIAEINNIVGRYGTSGDNSAIERTHMARDLYGFILPALCRTLEHLLFRCEDDGKLSSDACEQLCNLIDAAVNAADKACNWKPRPSTLDVGALSVMRNDIRRSLKDLQKRFNAIHKQREMIINDQAQLERLADQQKKDQERLQQERQRRLTYLPSASQPQTDLSKQRPLLQLEPVVPDESGSESEAFDEKKLLDAFESKQRQEQAKILDDRQKRYASITGNCSHRIPLKQAAATTGVAAALQKEVFDIDDIDIGMPSPPSSSDNALPPRPLPQRAQTEDIPGPVFPAWTTEESLKFTRLLEIYTKPSRFEEIFQQYGGPHGYLARHNVESLQKQASFIRQSMNSQLARLGPEWKWLRSIPV